MAEALAAAKRALSDAARIDAEMKDEFMVAVAGAMGRKSHLVEECLYRGHGHYHFAEHASFDFFGDAFFQNWRDPLGEHERGQGFAEMLATVDRSADDTALPERSQPPCEDLSGVFFEAQDASSEDEE